ncbi:GNAT family N-acetyltransferase [Bacillus chungangensis]|uniref:Ribosomal protein S18 acetylase RimI-like enzyme n=1 Tax=Bacillus chungangensis TaxID=587633 RepID=A0ABT9WRE2_9BACI|nr:GNAT family N-acetyltransferase [Bacillus chungangensis]MDQ0175335.1 ribosomal protein S18 acetylase RimI-like enzyme [Bacillus chungangensis]
MTAKEAGSFHILGTVRLKYHRDWQCYVLSRLAVKSAYKGIGIGTNLMKDGEKKLSKMGEIKIRLTVAQSHPYLVKMYEKKGYEIVEERFLPDLPYDKFVMEKSL